MDFFFSSVPASGSILNFAAILLGGLVGLGLHSRLPQRFVMIAFQGMGLLTLYLGILMAQKTQNFLVLALSIVAGSLLGEFLDIERAVDRMSEWIKGKIQSKNEKFTEGFVASSLLFCVGSMAILGAVEEGLGHFPRLLVTKSFMDGMAALAMSASMGTGVLFSSIPILLYEGGLTILARSAQHIMTQPVIDEVTAAGGLLLIGIAISILEIRRVRVTNMLPSLLLAGILASIFL